MVSWKYHKQSEIKINKIPYSKGHTHTHTHTHIHRGRPKLRWEDGAMEDARKLGERNWRNAARKRDSWQKLLKKALAQKGLLCQ